ncbi:MAG: 50S ribosomal protein L22 [Nanoarchaeota archaeon]
MTGYGYSTTITDGMAKAVSHNLPISTKISTQVCRYVNGMTLNKAKQALLDVMDKKQAVPMIVYYKETAHKPNMAVGRYPQKACKYVLSVIKSAEANAQFKGLSSNDLIIFHAAAQQGPTARGQGRTGGYAKQTHVEIVLGPKSPSKKHNKPAKTEAKK